MSRHHPAYWVERLKQAKVLVVGDVMLDRFVSGRISRISPEAPVPVLKSASTSLVLGGAGNVVRNLSALGCRAELVSVAGPDGAADEIERLLGDLPGANWAVVREDSRLTTVKTRFVAERQQVLRVDSETSQPLHERSQSQILDQVRRRIGQCNVVLLSDYAKGLLSEEMLHEVIQAARQSSTAVLVDPKGQDYGRYRGSSLLSPNLKELGEAAGRPLSDDQEIVEAARQLIESCALQALLATRGSEGMSLVESSGQVTHLKAQAREIFDVSGAGDTVIAVMAAGLSVGAPLAQAAELANLAAGIVVGKVGTAVARADDLLESLHHRDLSAAEARILSLEKALEQADIWRRQGRSVGFTCGVFDLLHPGHLSLLRQASKSCDRLIVGLQGDESVRRFKGSDPVQNEATRAAILASLEPVDAVLIFQDDNSLPLLKALRPEVLVQSANASQQESAGADLVRSWGGRVALAQIRQDGSTAITELTKGTF